MARSRSSGQPFPPGCEIPMHTTDALSCVLQYIKADPEAFAAFAKEKGLNPEHVYTLVLMVHNGRIPSSPNKETLI